MLRPPQAYEFVLTVGPILLPGLLGLLLGLLLFLLELLLGLLLFLLELLEIQDGDPASRRGGEAPRDLLHVRLEESERRR